jgi:tRNA dimethylallyltransferase
MNVPPDQIIFLVGPTAVGKSSVAMHLASMIDGEILSCDSMQVYREIHIASDRPPTQMTQKVPHHLIGCVSIEEEFNVQKLYDRVCAIVPQIHQRRRTPIIVGGSRLYMQVLMDGIFAGGGRSESVRAQLTDRWNNGERDGLIQELQRVDPEAAHSIHPHDARRIIRALEVFITSGQPFSKIKEQRMGLWDMHPSVAFCLFQDRKMLYDKIDQRVNMMFDNGVVDEIRSLRHSRLSRSAKQLIGIKEVLAYLNGVQGLDETVRLIQRNSRRLAKRQLTWFRHESRLNWLDVADKSPDRVAKEIHQFLSERIGVNTVNR